MKTYGFFENGGFRITDANTPRHWYNYLYNDEYITFVSQVGFGQGLAQDDLGRRVRPVDDRAIYIVDENGYFLANALPIPDDMKNYSCVHNIGYTDIKYSKNGLKTNCRFFVPTKEKKEYICVSVTNTTDTKKEIKIIPFIETAIDCRYSPQGYETDHAERMRIKNGVAGYGYSDFGGKMNYNLAYLISSESISGFDTRRNAFIGPYGNKILPKALIENGGCTHTKCIAEKICLAVENTVTLGIGETKTVCFAVGVEQKECDIAPITKESVEKEFEIMQKHYKDVLGGVTIKTPWDELNNLYNDWLKYQTNMGSRWARVRHNGFRDLTSDTECLSCFNPTLASERLKRILCYQYENGYAPRTFVDGQIRDNNFADNTVWLTFCAYAITNELGDTQLLNTQVEFNNGSRASVYEHLKRSVEFLHSFTGHHGLVRIWGGDWNDCMDKAGMDGKGVSVWLSIAFVRAAKQLAQLAELLKKDDDKNRFLNYAKEMQEKVNTFGFEGDRYLYAISDELIPIGSKSNSEGSMYALPQLWSVLADFEKDRCETVMETLEKELNTDLGLLVSRPPYVTQFSHIGSMTRKYAGVHENGGVYLHAAVWKLAVDSILGKREKVEEGLEKILPTRQKYYETCGEPYVLFNSYLGEQTGYRAGKPGQSWRTASGQWLLYSLTKFVFGLWPQMDGLQIKPCLPPSWQTASVQKVFRNCKYNITYKQTLGGKGEIKSISVNGKTHDKNAPIKPISNETLEVLVEIN